MEALQRRHGPTGINLATDSSLRMSSRPPAVAPGKGRAHDDFGSDLGSRNNSQKSKQRGSQPVTPQKSIMLEELDSDTDELDCLSQASKGSADAVIMVNPNLEGAVQGAKGVTTKDGQVLGYHPDFKPKPKLPKFKKVKSADANETSSSVASSSKPSIPKPKFIHKQSPPSKTHNREEQVACRHFYASSSKGSRPKDDPQETPRPRPHPRRKNAAGKEPAPAPFLDMLPGPSTQDSSQEKHNILSAVQNKPLFTRGSRHGISTSRPESCLQPKPFPKMSPPSSPIADRPQLQPQAFPKISPLGSQKSKGKQRALGCFTDQDEELEPQGSFTSSKSSIKPFPLSDQFFNSSQTSPGSKRSSEDSDHGGSSRKKRKGGGLGNLPDSPPAFDEPSGINEQDLLFLDAVDHSTLCPWCDEPLPTDPTPHLISLIESVRLKSSPEVRFGNPLGLKASVGLYVGVCKRHRFESHQIPLAKAKGWPTHIDFNRLKHRVEALKDDLEALILNRYPDTLSDDSSDDSMYAKDDRNRPRSKCFFWQELMGDVKAKGTRAMASAKGQFANFNKLQPGYYGELGYIMISQTIYQLFPPSSIDSTAVAPLTPQEFTQRILVPEAAVRLIMEDRKDNNKRKAIETLRESVEYGVAMFPDTGEDGEAVDEMIKERANARRKELEVEDALEKDAAREKRRKKGGYHNDTMPSSPSSVEASSRLKQKKITEKRNTVVAAHEAVGTGDFDDILELSKPPRPSPRKKRRKQDDESTSTDASSTSRINLIPMRDKRFPRRRTNRIESTDSSDVEIVSDYSKASRRLDEGKEKVLLSESESDLPNPNPPKYSNRRLQKTSSYGSHNEQRDHWQDEDTPKASKVRKHSLRPLDIAKQRKPSVGPFEEDSCYVNTTDSAKEDYNWLLDDISER